AKTRSALTQGDWYRIADGKGVLLLHELRRRVGDAEFVDLMDAFGKRHAGKEVTAAEFRAHVERSVKQPVGDFFDFWLNQPGLPRYRLAGATVETPASPGGKHVVCGEITREGSGPQTAVEVTVECEGGKEVTCTCTLSPSSPRTTFAQETEQRPRRVVVDKYG